MTSRVLFDYETTTSHDGRQLIGINLHVGEVYGNLTDQMYFYTDVYVGDPNNPSKQSLILDTGSHISAFP